MKISLDDVSATYDDMFESKAVKFIKKIPRAHLLVLSSIKKCYQDEQHRNKKDSFQGFSSKEIINVYNN